MLIQCYACYRLPTPDTMDCDVERRRTRSGRMVTRLVLLPDADISDPENESDSDVEPDSNQEESSGDDGSSSDDDLPLQRLVTKTKDCHKKPNSAKTDHEFRWRKKMSSLKHSDTEWKGAFSDPPAAMEPVEYFRMFFRPPLIEKIVEQSNVYAVQSGSSFRTDLLEIEQYVGVLIKMGLVRMPRYRYPPIADVLSRNRLNDLSRYIHFNDNSQAVTNREDPNYDRYFKVRPLLMPGN